MKSSNRGPVIIGNWKMHKTVEEAKSFVQELLPKLEADVIRVGLAVPFTVIYPLVQLVKGSKLWIGAQNMNEATEGAFTGEIAARMLLEAGAQFTLLGHSERRRLYHEDNTRINRKLKKAVEDRLRPILCIGETREEYEAQQTHAVIETQLTECLKDIPSEQLHQLIIAYEPVWAISNGHSATPEIAQEAQSFCRQILSQYWTEELAQKTPILYGGSVNPSNAKDLLSQPDIDGLLIGSASLSLESFVQIVNDSQSILI